MSCIAQFAQAYGPFITAGAIFISGGIAWLAIIHNLRTARRRATIDLMMHEKANATLLAARKIVLSLHDDKAKFTEYALQEHAGREERMAILSVLNFQEFIALLPKVVSTRRKDKKHAKSTEEISKRNVGIPHRKKPSG